MTKAGSPDDIAKWFRGKVEKNNAEVNGLLHAAAEFGVELVQQHIATRGTHNGEWEPSWDTMANAKPGRYESEPGRVAGGEMINAVSSWVSEGGKDGKSRMAFGWTHPSERKEYFLAQEGGFTHKITGEYIEGMHAISDAATEVFDWLEGEVKEILK